MLKVGTIPFYNEQFLHIVQNMDIPNFSDFCQLVVFKKYIVLCQKYVWYLHDNNTIRQKHSIPYR